MWTRSLSNPIPTGLDARFRAADEATREGRFADAITTYRQILEIAPENARALNALGNRMLAAGDATAACDCLRRAVAADPQAPPIWLNLSFALRAAGSDVEELAALDKALALDPYFVIALLHKAQWLERHDVPREATRSYRALLDAAPPLETLPPSLRAMLEHGQEMVSREDESIAAAIAAEIGSERVASQRLRHCFDILAGRRKVYVQQPAGLHIPYLPAMQFFDRSQFPWLAELEASTDIVREEFLALLAAGGIDKPYVQVADGQPVNQWTALNHSLDWGAQFLWKDGAPAQPAMAQCPRTTALLRTLPLLDVPHRGPNVMFSTLRARSHIPPHHGVTNMRAVVHLPLIVPAGCRFRVGSETRPWVAGEAWAFDDTIEHEAWNDSEETRVIMLIDAWNPYLDEQEKVALRQANAVLGAFGNG
jgi:aspartyl/asparaginyl beta-hydroxylase (cupin superfamily)